ncbi:hypothetical protein [Wenyingzhuangia sp. IMCC45574]
MKRFIYLFLIVATLFSCSNDDVSIPKYHLERLSIDEITFPDNFTYNEIDTIWFKYTLPTKCHYFYDLDYTLSESTRYMSIISYVDDDPVTCEEETTLRETYVPIKITQTEDYVFKIWKGIDDDDENIYEEYTVPVIAP